MESNERAPLWFKILCAAASFDGTFTKQDLAVRAWEDHPHVFGLAGYADKHPDANAVNAKLYGCAGLVTRGLVEACDGRAFRVTAAGRRMVASGKPDTPRHTRHRSGAKRIAATVPTPQPLAEVFARAAHTTTLGPGFIGVPR